eukprot:1355078-Rhodomonas_salina.1
MQVPCTQVRRECPLWAAEQPSRSRWHLRARCSLSRCGGQGSGGRKANSRDNTPGRHPDESALASRAGDASRTQ